MLAANLRSKRPHHSIPVLSKQYLSYVLRVFTCAFKCSYYGCKGRKKQKTNGTTTKATLA